MSRPLAMFVVLGCAATPGRAQTPPPVQQDTFDLASVALLLSQFREDLTQLNRKVTALADAIPAEHYGWRPSEDVRSISQVLMHLAGEWTYLCPMSVAGQPPEGSGPPGESMRRLETMTVKADVLAQLATSWEHCRATLAATDPATLKRDAMPAKMTFARVALLMSGDQHEHLGQLISYARSVGVKPPWSR